jgi:TolB-like protein
MVQKTNSVERFWKELKRRKVVHVITVYSATAFVTLELVNMVARPLQLPDWTEAFVIVLLCIGFVIAIFLSWVYDITPAGVKKTKPVSVVKHVDQANIPISNGWKIATYLSAVIILALIAFNFITRRNTNKDRIGLEKSIAVLPFKLLSDEPDKQYLADGMMDAITLHLSKIKDLRVIGRTSVEQYRNPTKTTTAIGRELDVKFLLEGSFQKFGDNVKLIVQLIKTGKEGHVWANEYDRNWSDIFKVQSEVAQRIANELHAAITPEEKQLIEKIPTASLTAYDFYQRGSEEFTHYWIDNILKDNIDTIALGKAEDFYRKALECDSTFAAAYTGLAKVYWDKHYWATILSEKFLDSVPVLCSTALICDNQLSDAYTIMGDYYQELGKHKQAIEDYNKAISFNPNDWSAFYGRGNVYYNYDLVKCLEDFQKAVSHNHGPELPSLLHNLGATYSDAGFIEKAKYYSQEALQLDKDSIMYLSCIYSISDLAPFHYSQELVKLWEKEFSKDPGNLKSLWEIGLNYVFLHQPEKALQYFNKYLQKKSEPLNEKDFFGFGKIAWAFMSNGYNKEGEFYLNEQINYLNKLDNMGHYSDPSRIYYDLAGAYVLKGEKRQAFNNLRKGEREMDVCQAWIILYLKYDPLFDSIRNESEFQQIFKNVEAKYQAEHERVRKWLEEQGML